MTEFGLSLDSREYPARPIAAVGVIVRKDDTVLLIRRGNPPRRGEWGIPGGAVEIGERWRDAARREVREECGIEIQVGEIVDAIDIIVRDDAGRAQYHYAIADFAASYVSGELRAASDVLEARWVALADLDAFALPDPTRAVIRKAMGFTPPCVISSEATQSVSMSHKRDASRRRKNRASNDVKGLSIDLATAVSQWKP